MQIDNARRNCVIEMVFLYCIAALLEWYFFCFMTTLPKLWSRTDDGHVKAWGLVFLIARPWITARWLSIRALSWWRPSIPSRKPAYTNWYQNAIQSNAESRVRHWWILIRKHRWTRIIAVLVLNSVVRLFVNAALAWLLYQHTRINSFLHEI